MKIMCCCGQGLGSSFMVEMNVNKVLKKLGVEGVEVSHGSASEANSASADLFIVGNDLYETMKDMGEVITLTNIVSMPELEEKLSVYLKDQGKL